MHVSTHSSANVNNYTWATTHTHMRVHTHKHARARTHNHTQTHLQNLMFILQLHTNPYSIDIDIVTDTKIDIHTDLDIDVDTCSYPRASSFKTRQDFKSYVLYVFAFRRHPGVASRARARASSYNKKRFQGLVSDIVYVTPPFNKHSVTPAFSQLCMSFGSIPGLVCR